MTKLLNREIFLVDTSVWINFFKGIETESSKFLISNLNNIIIATCPTIVQEMLQGVTSNVSERTVKSHFDNLTKLHEDAYDMAVKAAELYRDLRTKGVTIRKPNDCLIAIYAMSNKLTLLHDDRDFQFIAQHSLLKVMSFHE
jgi:predicted nucleic acid-binding protein